MFGEIAGLADALKIGNKLVGILDRLTSDTRVKAEFEETGKIEGTFSLGDYHIVFTVSDKMRTTKAEVTEVE